MITDEDKRIDKLRKLSKSKKNDSPSYPLLVECDFTN